MDVTPTAPHVILTGGAGYIGSRLTGVLLRRGYRVTVIDTLHFGGESLLAYQGHPRFRFVKGDVTQANVVRQAAAGQPAPEAVIHLAALVGFPACRAAGREVAWRINVEATQRVFDQAVALGARRLLFASTYSVYGLAPEGQAVDETSPLHPQSLYAETKIAAEEWLLAQADAPTAPLIFRLATLYGLSPRMRFDLIVNQFVLEAYTNGELLIYQRDYARSFVHLHDVVHGFLLGLTAPEGRVRGQVYNLGTEQGNLTKQAVVDLVLRYLPDTRVRYRDLAFAGDMRHITASFAKVRHGLGFTARHTVEDGIREVLRALREGWFRDPWDDRYRNARFIVQ